MSRADQWARFVTALQATRGKGGYISSTRVAPLLAGIPNRRQHQLYKQAIRLGYIRPIGYEPAPDRTPAATYHWTAA